MNNVTTNYRYFVHKTVNIRNHWKSLCRYRFYLTQFTSGDRYFNKVSKKSITQFNKKLKGKSGRSGAAVCS